MQSTIELLNYTSDKGFIDQDDQHYLSSQWGACVHQIHRDGVDIREMDLIIIGCGERRGQNGTKSSSAGPDAIRKAFFKLHNWHPALKVGDIGNIIEGATLQDTRAALRTVLSEIHAMGKKALVLGGSHDLTLQQYDVFRGSDSLTDLTIVDMLADIDESSENRYDNYLMEALTQTPNYVRHFNLIGFQSYYVNPQLIETFDKLRFDCTRVGKARENLEWCEPAFRDSGMVSIDINAVRFSDAPANRLASPNGFYGDEICKITRFAGMGSNLSSMGIYGYEPEHDTDEITAKLIAQMIWYFMDGLLIAKQESPLDDRNQFLEYHLRFTDQDAYFLKSKHSNRWWMQLPDAQFIPCTHQDYITACNNEIPERWMRAVERLV
jgi:arginase family enzyme